MKRLKQKQFRILFLFILGVGVPSLLLGYLAFRGIRNDQALLEREKREDSTLPEVRIAIEQAAGRMKMLKGD